MNRSRNFRRPLLLLSGGAFMLTYGACVSDPPPPSHCPCFFSEMNNAYLLGDAEIRTIETNSSERAIRGERKLEAEGALRRENNSMDVELRLDIPYMDAGGSRFYRETTVRASADQAKRKDFIARVCLKERLYTDPSTCQIKPEYIEQFSREIDELAAESLRAPQQAKDEVPPTGKSVSKSPPREERREKYKVLILFPDGVSQPAVRVSPAPLRKEIGKFSCEVEIYAQDYRIELEENGLQWAAQFDHQSGVIPNFRFIKINSP